MLWISVSISIILLSTWTGLLLAINQVVGAANISDVVLAAFVAFLIIVSIYFSVRLSELTERNRKIAQHLALLNLTQSKDRLDCLDDKNG